MRDRHAVERAVRTSAHCAGSSRVAARKCAVGLTYPSLRLTGIAAGDTGRLVCRDSAINVAMVRLTVPVAEIFAINHGAIIAGDRGISGTIEHCVGTAMRDVAVCGTAIY